MSLQLKVFSDVCEFQSHENDAPPLHTHDDAMPPLTELLSDGVSLGLKFLIIISFISERYCGS